jgi:NAD(P)-dependent dehydrogenase (short-subunit alcohol dehydrogenase family)
MTIDLNRRNLLAGLTAATASVAAGTAIAQAPTVQMLTGQGNPATGRFAGKVVAITGATSGIGEATALAFAREGASVAFCGRREALGREVASRIEALGARALYVRADVRDPAQLRAFTEATVARFGGLDIAFNNAGIGQAFVEMDQIDVATQRDLYETNVMGKYNAMVAQVPHLARSRGTIVNMSSIFGIKSGAKAVAYSATMHAVTGMTLGAALELAPKGIRVNGVAPGAITDTDFMVPIIGRRLNEQEIASFGPLHALGRTGTSAEVAAAVLFLASPQASFITGEILKVDGYFLNG